MPRPFKNNNPRRQILKEVRKFAIMENDNGLSAEEIKELVDTNDLQDIRDYSKELCEAGLLIKLDTKYEKPTKSYKEALLLGRKNKKPKYKEIPLERYTINWDYYARELIELQVPEDIELHFDIKEETLEAVKEVLKSEQFKKSYSNSLEKGKVSLFLNMFLFNPRLLKNKETPKFLKKAIKGINEYRKANEGFQRENEEFNKQMGYNDMKKLPANFMLEPFFKKK